MALPKSHSQSVLPNPRLLVLETIEQFEDRFLLTVRVQQVPLCPECGRASESRHSHYVRRLQDLPWQGLSVQIHLRVRRFRCRNPDCQRRVFTERVEGVPPYLRQTSRLAEIVRLVGYVAGGLPGARLLARLAILTSDDTVLRRVKVPSSATLSSNPPDVLGVDDWAWRKGHTYGTILVDLEQHCVVDLLPCRSAESFEAWLKEQPRIGVISRDRSGLYAEGARLGSPAAMQVADRFHLLLNLSAAVERALEERSRQLQLPFPAPPPRVSLAQNSPQTKRTRQDSLKQQRRQRRLDRYGQVIGLYHQGCSQRRISESLEIERKTVRRWIRAGQFPERKPPRQRPPQVHRFAEYLQRRWEEGCHNATRLFQEIRLQGYRGGRGMVARHVAGWRNPAQAFPTARPQKITPKQAAILGTKPAAQLTAEQQLLLDQLSAKCPDLLGLRKLVGDFREVLRCGEGQSLLVWMKNAKHSGIGPVARFAVGLEKDFSAVLAAVETPWSNGQVEGQINRLKTLKRQMFGRAGFPLLRARVLPYAPFDFTPVSQPP